MKLPVFLLLTLLCITGTIELQAQTPPMPPKLPWTNPVFNPPFITNEVQKIKRPKTYTANCPHCQITYANLHPLNIITNGSVATNGGCIVQRTMTFACPNRDCRERFDSRNTVFMPESIAIEDGPVSGAGGGTAGTWTTNANLRLAIEILNKGTPFILLGVTNNQVVSNTISLGIGPIPMAAIRFPTELGKSYKCQATDDAKKTWLDGPIVAGTGHYVTNYEVPVKISRMYRVVENPM